MTRLFIRLTYLAWGAFPDELRSIIHDQFADRHAALQADRTPEQPVNLIPTLTPKCGRYDCAASVRAAGWAAGGRSARTATVTVTTCGTRVISASTRASSGQSSGQ